jgi:hypothetical protein
MATVSYELLPRTVLDLRHHGAVELTVDGRYRALMQALDRAEKRRVRDLAPRLDHLDLPTPLLDQLVTLWRVRRGELPDPFRQVETAWARAVEHSRQVLVQDVCARLAREHGYAFWESTDCARRVGIGDLLIEVHVAQAVARALDGELCVVYDPAYPACSSVWPRAEQRGGVVALPVRGDATLDPALVCAALDWERVGQLICLRGHPQEAATGGIPRYSYATEVGYAGAQMLYELGWHELVDWRPVRIDLRETRSDVANAWALLREAGLLRRGSPTGYATVQPVEHTRRNRWSGPALWRRTLADVDLPLLVGCARQDASEARRLIGPAAAGRATFVHAPIMTWISLVRRARQHLTANTSGLWFGLAAAPERVQLVETVPAYARPFVEPFTPKPSWAVGGV